MDDMADWDDVLVAVNRLGDRLHARIRRAEALRPLLARAVVATAVVLARKAGLQRKSCWRSGTLRRSSCGCTGGGACRCKDAQIVCRWNDGGVCCRLPGGQDKLFSSEAEARHFAAARGLRVKGAG
jgi:hypothetical protein